jgi:signal transduction histidine kinase
LEQRITAKSAALELSYQQLRANEIAVERDAAREQERDRLVRDMHDGLGAQLITALRGMERGAMSTPQVALALQASLDDLRMLMDSSDKGHTLQFALANWRNRGDWRLQAAGLALDWQIPVALEELIFQGDTVLQIMRILQEAATNAVKHAQATVLRVQISSEAGQWHLDIEDNGKGLPDIDQATPSLGGRGLRNMQERAAKIHARLDMDSPPEPGGRGTRMRLTLPESVKADF